MLSNNAHQSRLGDNMSENKHNYFTVKQTAERHPAFSEASLRYIIFNSHQNGFDKTIKRIGRKILINEALFLEWIENQEGGAS